MQRPKRSGDHWYFWCPYRYVLNERKRPRDAKLFYGTTETKKSAIRLFNTNTSGSPCIFFHILINCKIENRTNYIIVF